MDTSFADKLVMVTGASGGIGSAVARAFAAAGADLVLADIDQASLAQVAEDLPASSRRADVRVCDLSTAGGVQSLFAGLDRLDVLVNCLGIQIRKPALDLTASDIDLLMGVNFKAPFICCQEAARIMRTRRSGKIVNITSLAEFIGIRGHGVYAASKGALAQASRVFATEWAEFGIQVNLVAPGRVETPMTQDVFDDAAVRQSFQRLIPAGRAAQPADLVGSVLFLASPAADYVTGHTLVVDGGWLAAGGNPGA